MVGGWDIPWQGRCLQHGGRGGGGPSRDRAQRLPGISFSEISILKIVRHVLSTIFSLVACSDCDLICQYCQPCGKHYCLLEGGSITPMENKWLLDDCWKWLSMVDNGWPWLTMVDKRLTMVDKRLTMVDNGGQLWKLLFGCLLNREGEQPGGKDNLTAKTHCVERILPEKVQSHVWPLLYRGLFGLDWIVMLMKFK